MKYPDPRCQSRLSECYPGKDALIKRLNRIQGQVRGISKMIDEDRYCSDILTQVSAIKSALDETALKLLENYIQSCVRGAIKSGEGDGAISELTDVSRKFLRT